MAAFNGLTAAQPTYYGNGTVSSTNSLALKTGTPSLTLTYSVNTNYVPAVINYQLSLQNLDVSAWGVTGNAGSGMYMGFGVGKANYSDTDYLWCRYTFTNRATDALICNDAYVDSKSVAANDTQNDLYNVTSTSPASYVRTSKSTATANFVVSFARPARTNDTSSDFQMSNQTYDLIWQYGFYTADVAQAPTLNGTTPIDLTMVPHFAEPQESNALHLAATLLSVVALVGGFNFL